MPTSGERSAPSSRNGDNLEPGGERQLRQLRLLPSPVRHVRPRQPDTGIEHSSLWLRTAAGKSWGDRDNAFANFFFGGFGNNWIDYQEVCRYRDHYAFPGVELNEIGGTDFVKATLEWTLPPVRFQRLGRPSLLRELGATGAVHLRPGDRSGRQRPSPGLLQCRRSTGCLAGDVLEPGIDFFGGIRQGIRR